MFGALLFNRASTISGTNKFGNKEVYRLPGPRTIRSASFIDSMALGRAEGFSGR